MKKIVALICGMVLCHSIEITAAMVTTDAGPTARFILKGTAEGISSGWVYLAYMADGDKLVKDSTMIKDQQFAFSGDLPYTMYVTIRTGEMSGDNSYSFFLEPGTVSIKFSKGKLKDAVVTGSQAQKQYEELKNSIMLISKETASISARSEATSKLYNEARRKNDNEHLIDSLKYAGAAIHDEFEPYQKRMKQEQYRFYETHPTSIVTAYYLRFAVSSLTLDSLNLFYSRLGAKTQQTVYGKYIGEELASLRAGSPGHTAAVFTAKDIDGNPLSLSDYKGKYVLLDFWASWCVPCRKGNPHLKDLYSKYQNKGFEIIGISDDDRNPGEWKKAVAKDGLPWKHVLRGFNMDKRPKGEKQDNEINDKYGIHTLPTKILIGPDGVIIGRYSEEEEALDSKLKEVFRS